MPYGQQRLLEIALALATRPKVLLLDEPAAGVPKDESAMLFGVIAALPEDISVLFIEHDMNIVFSFASRIIVLVSGGVLVEAPTRGRAQRSARCAKSISARRGMAEPAARTSRRPRRLWRGRRARRVSPSRPANGSLAVLGRNGVGKTTLLLTAMGFVKLARGRSG